MHRFIDISCLRLFVNAINAPSCRRQCSARVLYPVDAADVRIRTLESVQQTPESCEFSSSFSGDVSSDARPLKRLPPLALSPPPRRSPPPPAANVLASSERSGERAIGSGGLTSPQLEVRSPSAAALAMAVVVAGEAPKSLGG